MLSKVQCVNVSGSSGEGEDVNQLNTRHFPVPGEKRETRKNALSRPSVLFVHSGLL